MQMTRFLTAQQYPMVSPSAMSNCASMDDGLASMNETGMEQYGPTLNHHASP